jgi:hypothetical protein
VKRHGITLTEVMIAMLVMVLGIMPLLTLFSQEDRESSFIGQKLIVQNYLRELADQTQSTCIAEHFTRGAFEVGPREAILPQAGDGVKITERIQMIFSDKVPGLYTLRIEAHWKDPTGVLPGVREQILTRLMCDPDFGTRHTQWPPGSTAATVGGTGP